MLTTITTIKLGTVCKDKATCLTGTITHWLLDMDQKVDYIFQPEGVNPETGQPVDKIFMEKGRMILPEDCLEEIRVPLEILGSTVTDKASGFTGMAIGFVCHLNGCFHVTIQPPGSLPKNNCPIRKAEFDLRQCKGEKILELSQTEKKKSTLEKPSPTGDEFNKQMPVDNSVSQP